MLCLPFIGLGCPAANSSSAVLRLALAAGGQASVDVGTDRVEVDVRRGSVWLTEDRVDHLLDGGARFACAGRRRVVITALSDATLDVRRQRRP